MLCFHKLTGEHNNKKHLNFFVSWEYIFKPHCPISYSKHLSVLCLTRSCQNLTLFYIEIYMHFNEFDLCHLKSVFDNN